MIASRDRACAIVTRVTGAVLRPIGGSYGLRESNHPPAHTSVRERSRAVPLL
jgi:hypothetical protein